MVNTCVRTTRTDGGKIVTMIDSGFHNNSFILVKTKMPVRKTVVDYVPVRTFEDYYKDRWHMPLEIQGLEHVSN